MPPPPKQKNEKFRTPNIKKQLQGVEAQVLFRPFNKNVSVESGPSMVYYVIMCHI